MLKAHIVLPSYLGITSLPIQKHHRIILIRRDFPRSSSPAPCSKKNQMSMRSTGENIHTETTLLQSTHKKRSQSNLISHLEKCQQPPRNLTISAGYGAANAQEGPGNHRRVSLVTVETHKDATGRYSSANPVLSYQNPINCTGITWAYLCSDYMKWKLVSWFPHEIHFEDNSAI